MTQDVIPSTENDDHETNMWYICNIIESEAEVAISIWHCGGAKSAQTSCVI
jgi:hypothetical protein